jgi:hypothetical protein
MNQSDPPAAHVAMWLKTISQEQLQDQGWITINKRYHGIVRAARPYLQERFTGEKEQGAAFDGFTLALLAVAHFEDIEQLKELFTTTGVKEEPAAKPSLMLPPPEQKSTEAA